MFNFPKGVYCDVRIEDVFETKILYNDEDLEECKKRMYKGAFIRMFDGERWYYSSISDTNDIQNEINTLYKQATPKQNIDEYKVVKKIEVNKGKYIKYSDNSVKRIDISTKKQFLKEFLPVIKSSEYIVNTKYNYTDGRTAKSIYSSKGTNLKFDTQFSGFSVRVSLSNEDKKFQDVYQGAYDNFEELMQIDKHKENLKKHMEKCEDMLLNSVDIIPGKYTVILSPIASGMFAHECFGHKSEADFMIGDETMKKEWKIGKKVGADKLSIVDCGDFIGKGYTPFDDEGSKSRKTYLIKDGILTDRLHSSVTASELEENLTGNARAINFEYEPIVRMTTTYIEPGNKTKEELISETATGILVESLKHGTGMSTFTLAPSLAYLIKDGEICEPVKISVISGNVMESLDEIDGLSKDLEIECFVLGGCGKLEQSPLPVGFGGPYVRVNNLNVN